MEPVEQIEKQADGFVIRTRGGGELHAKAVIIATGTKQQRLTVPGEKDFIMRGLCYSALSYAPLFIERKVVQIDEGHLEVRLAVDRVGQEELVHLVGASG